MTARIASAWLAPLVLVCAHASVLAQASSLSQAGSSPLAGYTVVSWNESDGLPAGRIRGLAQDADGYLWLATDSGLFRFDGLHFESWSAHDETRLPSGGVSALLSARDGSLWVGVTGRAPISRIKDGHVTTYDERSGLVASHVLALLEDRDGTIWAGAVQGLFRLADGRWQKLGEGHGVAASSVLALHEDKLGRIWVATSKAVLRKERGHDRFVTIDEIPISSNVWSSFSEDDHGTVWISDFNRGFRAPGTPAGSPPLRRGWGGELLHDRRGNLWIGTQGQGLWRTRTTGKAGRGTIDVATTEHGLASNAVQAMLEDRDGNIWLGTLGGLQRLTPHRVAAVKNLPIPRAIEVTPDGSVWIGTAFGLVRFSASGRRHYTEADGLQGSVILALYADDRGDLWISTERGLVKFSQGRFSPLVLSAGGMQRIVGISGTSQSLWLRDFYLRIFLFQAGQLTAVEGIPATYLRSITSIYTGKSGNLWLAAPDGRIGLRSADGSFESHDGGIGEISTFLEDSHGDVWIGGEDGLSRFSHGTFIRAGARNGVTGGVKSFVEDEFGFLWVGTDKGILRLEKDEFAKLATDPGHQLHFRLFNTADGAAGVPHSEGSGTAKRGRDGRLWFIASTGVTIVDPRNLGDAPRNPVPRIESATANATAFGPGASLAPGTSHLQIAFNAPTLYDPTRVRFRYQLEGFDRDWVDAGAARQAAYTNLPPRQYRFRVMASGSDGAWGEPGATIDFNIEPMFYQTRWFLMACALGAFLLVFASWRLHVRQVRREFAMVLAERIRMSRAIHDTLLQGLAALALQVDDLSHNPDVTSPSGRNRILGIRRQVEEYIRQARKSILDLRTPTLASRDLAQSLREVAQRAIAGRPVALDVTVNGTPRSYTASVEEQLLLIGQEAVNNAVHHGQPSRVAVELDYAQDRMRLKVTDDGCGFDTETARLASGHYGLISMRERAEQVHGRLRISSTPGRGTEIETVVPT